MTFDPAEFIEFNPTPVSWQAGPIDEDHTFDCLRNCDAVRAAAEKLDGGSWCWLPFSHCTSVEERMRQVVYAAVSKQHIFNSDGTLARVFVEEQGTQECWQDHATPADCSAPAVQNAAHSTQLDSTLQNLDEAISQMLMVIPGGFEPKDLCGGPESKGGTYRLVDRATGETRYVGETGNFAARKSNTQTTRATPTSTSASSTEPTTTKFGVASSNATTTTTGATSRSRRHRQRAASTASARWPATARTTTGDSN